MKELLGRKQNSPILPQIGDLLEGTILKITNTELILDLGPLGTGIIYGGELKENKEMVRDLKIGQQISALVLDPEDEDGYIELSMKEARVEKSWTELKVKKQNNETVAVKVIEANRGGLVIGLAGVVGFLPVSQLSTENYPRVEGGDKNKILQHLSQFISKEMQVKIISLDKETDKLIVSEKAVTEEKNKKNLDKHKEGEIVEGIVTTLTDFGAFIKFGDNLEGLAHISELDWQMIDHPSQILKENEKVKAQIINIQNNQVALSLKSLKQDPWQDGGKKYQNGQTIKGKVIKFNPLGAFIEVEKGIRGLIHAKGFTEHNQQIEKALTIGQSYNFEILSIVPIEHKMALKLAE